MTRRKPIFGARRGEISWGLRNVPRVGWVSVLRADDVRTVSIVRNSLSLSLSLLSLSLSLSLSLLMSKNLKLKKVIKSFVPEPKKRVVSISSVFGFPMSISRIHILVVFWTWICYIRLFATGSTLCCHGYFTHWALKRRLNQNF